MSDRDRQQRTIWCWFCDDVRFEVGNKMSLMGIYGGELYLTGKPPTLLPKLVLVLEIVTAFEDRIGDIGIRVRMRGAKQDLFGFTFPVAAIPPKTDDMARLVLRSAMPFSPFVVPEEGVLEVYADINGESVRAGRIGIHFVAPQEEAQPPEQSQ